MALGTLSLSTTTGVQGRPFQATINGLTTGRVEVLTDGSPGFSTVNGKLMSNGLPYPVSTVVLREYEPGVGQGYRDTRIDITAATREALQALALASLSPGRTLVRYRVVGDRQADGSLVYSIRADDDLGAAIPMALNGTPTPTPTPSPTPSPAPNGVVPSYGLVSTTADGSSGQTYTLNAAWTGIQWYRMSLGNPSTFTAISGATGTTYVSQKADEGYRLAVTGTESGASKAVKSYHVVLPPPVILEDFENAADWTVANAGVLSVATDTPAYGTKRLQLVGTGTANPAATKAAIGSYDTSTLGTIVGLIDLSMDAGHPGGASITMRKSGADQASLNFGTLYETPTPLAIGKLWGALHVSENPALAAPGGASVGVKVTNNGQIPFAKTTKFDALLARAGGRPTVNINFDDNKITQYTVAYPLLKSLGLTADLNNVGSTSSNPAAFNLPRIKEVYADGWDVGLDSTYNDNITASFGTLAAAGASLQQNRDYAVSNGLTRGNEHGCWTGGQIEDFPNPGNLPSNRILASSVTSDGSNVLTINSATAYPSGLTPQVGMRVTGFNVPDSPKTTITSVISATQVQVSANIPAQTKPMYFVDDSLEFYTMKLPVYYRDVLGMKTMRTTRADGGAYTRFGFADRAMFMFGVPIHTLSVADFVELLRIVKLRGLTVYFYTHGILSPGGGVEADQTVFTQQMQILAAEQNAGNLDVMNRSQIWARDGNASIPTGLLPPETVASPSNISYVSASSANTSPDMPAGHQAGDLLLAFAYRDGSNTIPSLPAGWTAISSDGLNNNAFLLAYKVATSGAEAAATFTNATNVVVHCYRSVGSTPIGSVSPIASGTSGAVTIPSGWTLQKADNTSWVAYFGGSRSATSTLDTVGTRSGHTNATSGSDAGGSDTAGPITVPGSLACGGSGGTNWYAIAVEIRA